MKIETFLPAVSLRPFIKGYRLVECEEERINKILPDTALSLAFRIRGEFGSVHDNYLAQLPATTFSGIQKSVRFIHYQKNTTAIIVLFKETGAAAFFKEPLDEYFELSLSMENFDSAGRLSTLQDQLWHAHNNAQAVRLIEQYLIERLQGYQVDKLIYNAIERINAAGGRLNIRELSNELYISQDAFEKRFRKLAGTTPKQFSSIVRIKAVIKQYVEPVSFYDLALDNGYYDQPHFNRDFKLFTGQTPRDFFRNKSTAYW
ncbi:AraC family transcriptional regulator [Deminuibacter soli]|uniref:AraC family transcriptional regulator n=2 Tax=Deminuibacter soli TaxID=2291815 RepID=A0A3E1NEK6_9BACT|nr:AraC family transcriptional regulator [Deminuibacter soli]